VQVSNPDHGQFERRKEMKKVYAVSSGSYSDYRVDAIFSTKKLAEEFMRIIPHNDYNAIEEYEIDPVAPDIIKRGYSIWSVHMLRDGNTESVKKREIELWTVGNIGHTIWRRSQASAYKGKGIPDILTSMVWAKTEKQAIKIVNEHRAQMIANGEWK
jgi:hypothetical protein